MFNNIPIFSKSGVISTNFGENCKIIQPVNIYDAVIGSDVFIGPFVEIQKNASIGFRTCCK